MIYNLSVRHKIPDDGIAIDVTSRSSDPVGRLLSPFNVGPVELYDEHWAYNVENAYQFAKIYAQHDMNGVPSLSYLEWATKGWQTKKPIKYPFGVWNVALYHWWDGKKLDRLGAQNEIFLPLYKQAVVKTEAFQLLKALYETTDKDIYLIDFEGFNHRLFNMSWDEVKNHPNWPIGQGFALCMILEGAI